MSSLDAVMSGGGVDLRPLGEEHREALKVVCAEDEATWPIYSISFDPDHFDASFDILRARPNAAPFAAFDGDALVGMTAFLGADPERGVVEIGNTFYAPRLRGTGFNRRVKALMLDRAFSLGFRRVEFRVDARNTRSRAALLKLGATEEGCLRADRITWTGHVRDTLVFSILAEEWPALNARH